MADFDMVRVYRRAWEKYVAGFPAYVLVVLTGVVFFLILVLLAVAVLGLLGTVVSVTNLAHTLTQGAIGFPLLVLLALFLFGAIIVDVFIKGLQWEISNQLYSGYEANINVAFQWVKHRFWGFFVTGLLVFVGVSLGLIFFIIPGLIFAIWWTLASYLVAKEELTGVEALARSRLLVSRAFASTVLTILAYFVLAILVSAIHSSFSSILSILLGMFWAPLIGSLYEELASDAPTATNAQEPVPAPVVEEQPIIQSATQVAQQATPTAVPVAVNPVAKKTPTQSKKTTKLVQKSTASKNKPVPAGVKTVSKTTTKKPATKPVKPAPKAASKTPAKKSSVKKSSSRRAK